jgi:hypothetical protein
MPESFEVLVNDQPVRVDAGVCVAVAIVLAGQAACRMSVSGEPRGAFCGMGACFECRAEVDGVRHVRTCQVLCRPDMRIVTGV